MYSRSQSSQLFFYFGTIATGMAVIAAGLVVAAKAASGLSQTGSREKTVVELQIESSREIRRALTAPITVPPLPPITARLARDAAAIAATQGKLARAKPSLVAMDAMAMDLSGVSQPSAHDYPVFDRHAVH
jgi:hypothetical protein